MKAGIKSQVERHVLEAAILFRRQRTSYTEKLLPLDVTKEDLTNE